MFRWTSPLRNLWFNISNELQEAKNQQVDNDFLNMKDKNNDELIAWGFLRWGRERCCIEWSQPAPRLIQWLGPQLTSLPLFQIRPDNLLVPCSTAEPTLENGMLPCKCLSPSLGAEGGKGNKLPGRYHSSCSWQLPGSLTFGSEFGRHRRTV